MYRIKAILLSKFRICIQEAIIDDMINSKQLFYIAANISQNLFN